MACPSQQLELAPAPLRNCAMGPLLERLRARVVVYEALGRHMRDSKVIENISMRWSGNESGALRIRPLRSVHVWCYAGARPVVYTSCSCTRLSDATSAGWLRRILMRERHGGRPRSRRRARSRIGAYALRQLRGALTCARHAFAQGQAPEVLESTSASWTKAPLRTAQVTCTGRPAERCGSGGGPSEVERDFHPGGARSYLWQARRRVTGALGGKVLGRQRGGLVRRPLALVVGPLPRSLSSGSVGWPGCPPMSRPHASVDLLDVTGRP